MSGTDSEGIRLNKYIASSGLCSRREADKYIELGQVTINGITAVQGSKVLAGDIVEVSGKKITPEDSMVYIAFNKPLGVTCTTDKRDPSNIIDPCRPARQELIRPYPAYKRRFDCKQAFESGERSRERISGYRKPAL